jgi:hypothetical protein
MAMARPPGMSKKVLVFEPFLQEVADEMRVLHEIPSCAHGR